MKKIFGMGLLVLMAAACNQPVNLPESQGGSESAGQHVSQSASQQVSGSADQRGAVQSASSSGVQSGVSTGQTATTSNSSSIQNQTTVYATTNLGLPSTGSAWQTVLPLGDGKYVTSGAKKGYIYVCNVAQGGGGAQGNPTWISGSSWYPSQKVAVQGSVSWPNASYSMTVSGSSRIIKSNGFPTDHPTGTFPISSSDPAYQFDHNPNTIKAQSYSFSLPAYPTILTLPNCIYGQVGIMNDGVALFDGFDAEYRDAVAHETQDAYEGHPEVTGEYHNHGFEGSLVKTSVSTVVGFAFDGFPITGPKLADGTYLTSSDLDECHGLTSAITLDGKSVTTYHYVLTQDFPYSVSCFRGKSYEPRPGGQQVSGSAGQQGTGLQSGPPQAAISACSGLSSGASCSFTTPQGNPINGTCQTPPNSGLACVPAGGALTP